VRHVAHIEKRKKSIRTRNRKPQRDKANLLRQEDNIKTDFYETRVSEYGPHLDRIQWWSFVDVVTGFGFLKGLGVS
jgi:hypothetical protein